LIILVLFLFLFLIKIRYFRKKDRKVVACGATFPSILISNADRVAFLTIDGSLTYPYASFEVWWRK
jgi:hypothetical protein